jgi:hypothetical protein
MSKGATKANSSSRAEKFAGTLHDAESRQLEHFVKSRNAELDKEIAAMKSRLGSSVLNMSVSGRGLTAMDAISGKFPNSSAVNMNSLRERERENEEDGAAHAGNSRHHNQQNPHSNSHGEISTKDNARAHSDNHEPPLTSANGARPGISNPTPVNIKSLLGRIKLKMEDNMMSPAGKCTSHVADDANECSLCSQTHRFFQAQILTATCIYCICIYRYPPEHPLCLFMLNHYYTLSIAWYHLYCLRIARYAITIRFVLTHGHDYQHCGIVSGAPN